MTDLPDTTDNIPQEDREKIQAALRQIENGACQQISPSMMRGLNSQDLELTELTYRADDIPEIVMHFVEMISIR